MSDGFQDDRPEEQRFIHTVTGERFYPLHPEPSSVRLLDIAHALSMKCRFTGHCREFYSVAEHSVHMSRSAGLRWGHEEALWSLLHDAGEAYLPDVSRPLKKADAFEGFDAVEEDIQRAVMQGLGIPWPDETTRERVKVLDTRIVVSEIRELMPQGDGTDLPDRGLPGFDPKCWQPEEAKHEFLDEFRFIDKFL